MNHNTGAKIRCYIAWLLLVALGTSTPSARVIQSDDRGARVFSALPAERWVQVHQQKSSDHLSFKRQSHAGSTFDTRRGRLIVFGSDTHGKDWTNSPLIFDTAGLEWSRLYPDDPVSTYRVNEDGIPVAGKEGNHPWAMHTFGAVVYDPMTDQVIVASFPGHMEPGRFTDAVVHLWPRIRRHPTWVLDLATGEWTALPDPAVHFFPYAAAFDSDRKLVIGYKSSGIYELSGKPRTWRQVTKNGLFRYHNNIVYERRNKAFVVFGNRGGKNDIVVYEPGIGRHEKMPTPGLRPPADEHAPMAFHERLGQTVVLIDRKLEEGDTRKLSNWQSETWIYDLSRDRWRQVGSATLPFGLGMNYNMEYDSIHEVLLLVATPPGQGVAVWALRL